MLFWYSIGLAAILVMSVFQNDDDAKVITVLFLPLFGRIFGWW